VNRRWLAITLIGVMPAVAIGYLIGSVTSEEPAPSPVVMAEPEVIEFTTPNLSLGPRPVGTWQWSELRGGECIAWFADAFAEQFDVVECTTPHEAEFVRATLASDDADARYPGDAAVEEFATEHCASWSKDDLIEGELFDDLVAESSFSLGKEAWVRGDRLVGCFVRQLDGELFTTKLVNE